MDPLSCGESLLSSNDIASMESVYVDPELDGNENDPIVVCGFSMRFPQEATSPERLWELIMKKRCAMTEFPPGRLNIQGFHDKYNRLNTIPVKGGHFLDDDLSVFDANFFSLSPAEATSLDPMQRWLLEEAYLALENAGIPMEDISGSRTAVYTGSFGFDYMLQLSRDPENPPVYAALGFGISMLANRLSWFFDLRGPSIGVDSACSSTAMAIDMARRSLHDRSCDMVMVAGCNITNSPESYLWMSNVGFLSPDSKCHSFDHRANGYARGEGVGVILLKRLSDAIRDGNTIRAVIRSTASNEDGKTHGITQPSRTAQECLIRETYAKAGLSMAHTRFFEAHGTGTAIGDPCEAQAIGSVFRKYRSIEDPVYVGALKSNIGHLEGASGLAALIKAILVLEKGIIPPNTNFERLNPKIDAEFLKLKFPLNAHPWPTAGLRRASINSFGYGGANSHIVLDDAYNYLRLRSLSGKHTTSHYPPAIFTGPVPESKLLQGSGIIEKEEQSRLLVWSSADKEGISRIITLILNWYNSGGSCGSRKRGTLLKDLAHTLNTHRSQLPWRSFAVLKSLAELPTLQSRISSPMKVASRAPRLGFVFSGQGAQWFAMGRELMAYSSFEAELQRAESYLHTIGCHWSVKDELLKIKDASNIDNPEFSQTLCLVLQVAITNLLRKFNVVPSAVVGHSSGEIAAAYASGYISCESAWKLAYYRALCARELAEEPGSRDCGAMMSVGLSQEEAKDVVAAANRDASTFGISIACINSPKNVTIAGETRLINQLKAHLDEQKVFARKLRVPVAYHSRQMDFISLKYKTMIGSISAPLCTANLVPMISSVTGKRAEPYQLMDPSYWVLNMTSTVQFAQAVSLMCELRCTDVVKKIDRSHLLTPIVDHLVEIGPHATLQGPLRDILRATPQKLSVGYNSILRRGCSAVETTLGTLGELYCMGCPINLGAVNKLSEEVYSKAVPSLLVDLPGYPFDHSHCYWQESRLSRNYRLRAHAPSRLLGVRSNDWNASEARWRHFISTTDGPWAEQHVINGTVLYPAAGMLVMVIEAAKQLVGEHHAVHGFTLRNVSIENPMGVGLSSERLEVQTHLHDLQSKDANEKAFEFAIRTWSDDNWILNCCGSIFVELSGASDRWTEQKSATERRAIARVLKAPTSHAGTPVDSQHMYRFLRQNGYEYGPAYQIVLQQQYNDTTKQAMAVINLFSSTDGSPVVHPVSLDAILHLAFTAKTVGGTRPMATSVPARFGCLWVANRGLSWPDNSSVTAFSTIRNVTKRGFTCAGGVLENDSEKELCLWFDDFELVNITSERTDAALLPNPKQFCMSVEYKVALDKLNNSEIFTFIRDLYPVKQDLSSFYMDVQQLVIMSLERLIKSVNAGKFDNQDRWRTQYWNWAQYHLEQSHRRPCQEEFHSPYPKIQQTIEDLAEKVAGASKLGRLYAEVALNLIAIFTGEVNHLELLLKSGLLKDGYSDWAGYACAKQAATYIDLLSHQVPGLNILEVGGGTAATTRNFISALRSGTDDSVPVQSLRCDRYDFTDISPAFLEEARKEFAVYHSQMTFSTLDIQRDFAEQGFLRGFYDVVVADNVLHITSDLGKVLRNVHNALKKGGKLIMQELLRPTGWTAGFVFGAFPGWWLGVEDDRGLSPNLAPSEWDTILKANGFSGVDIHFRDFDNDVAHQIGWLVTTATEDKLASSLTVQQLSVKHQAIIIIDNDSKQQHSLSQDLISPLQELTGWEPCILDVATASAYIRKEENAFVILLVDYGSSFIRSLDETTWTHLSSILQKLRRLLWVSAGGGVRANPDHGMIDGFARTLRSENYEFHLVTVALDLNGTSNSKATHILKIVREMLSRAAHENYEQEYIEIDGLLHTRRLIEADRFKSAIEMRVKPYQAFQTPLDGKINFKVSTISSLESDDTPHYMQISEPSGKTEINDTVEILVRAVFVHSRSRDFTTKPEEYPIYGRFWSGIVLRAGMHSVLSPGDKVLATHTGPLRSHVQISSKSVMKLPEDISFIDACSAIPPIATAYHAMINVGRVKPEHSVLIYDGANPVGQAALRLLVDRGVTNVWITAADEQVSAWISENHGLPGEHILPEAWFDSHSMLSYQWRQRFDIILTKTAKSLPSMLDYIKPGGRIIAIDFSATVSKDSRLTQSMPQNFCLSTIPIGMATPDALTYAIKIPSTVMIELKNESNVLPASDLTSIIARLHNPNHQMIIVGFDNDDIVDVRNYTQPEKKVSSKATYVIAGGFGGLGRAAARWLVDHGARYLVLISRSGPRTTEASELLSEFAEKGVCVEAPCCDISDRAVLRSVLHSCTRNLPPIKGCIQSTMVMTELIFPKLQYQDWKLTVDSKVSGSWNLHCELPKGLDFFILFSSIMGILGTGSLAAYNAGNTYQDRLAQYRVSQGERAVAIDLSAVPDAGYFVDHAEQLQSVQRVEKHELVYVKEVCALLEIFCNPENSLVETLTNPQIIVGLRPPTHWKHLEEVPFTMSQPFWGHMHHVAPLSSLQKDDNSTQIIKRERDLDIAERLAVAESLPEAADIVRIALIHRVSVLLGTPEDGLDEQKLMHSFGIDSLTAIDIRNWVGKVFQVDVPIFDILGGATFGSLGRTIACDIRTRVLSHRATEVLQ